MQASTPSQKPRKWFVAAPFFNKREDIWLSHFVPDAYKNLSFENVVAGYSHDRSRKVTGLAAWRNYLDHGNATWQLAQRSNVPSGIITCFPQLATVVGLRKKLAFSNMPLVAWNFNLGQLYPGAKKKLSRIALASVDRFVVHSRAEITAYSEWLDIEPDRFQFVPLQRAVSPVEFSEDVEQPFILSMGSAHRDYKLLFQVLAELQYPAVVVAGAHAVEGLTIPLNVVIRSGLTSKQCDELVQRARFSVIPVANRDTASGQVTLLDAMMFARPAIITKCAASVDYVTPGKDAILVEQGDFNDLKRAMETMWQDQKLRSTISLCARETVIACYSDEAIGRQLGNVLCSIP